MGSTCLFKNYSVKYKAYKIWVNIWNKNSDFGINDILDIWQIQVWAYSHVHVFNYLFPNVHSRKLLLIINLKPNFKLDGPFMGNRHVLFPLQERVNHKSPGSCFPNIMTSSLCWTMKASFANRSHVNLTSAY